MKRNRRSKSKLKRFLSKRGFTDKLYFTNLAFAWAFTFVCILLTIFSGMLGITDLSIVSVGMGTVWGELAIHSGFMIWKAKNENIAKFGQNNLD